jgi:hypothetical protein
MRIKTLIAGLVLSSVGLGSGVSHAAVTQITLRTPGQVCQPVDNAIDNAHNPSWIVNEWGIENGHNVLAQMVTCPVTTYMAGSLSVVNVYVWDRNGSQQVPCTLFRINSNGTKTAISSNFTLMATNSPSVQTIPLSTGGANSSTLSLLCTIPPATASGVSGISAVEAVYNSQP